MAKLNDVPAPLRGTPRWAVSAVRTSPGETKLLVIPVMRLNSRLGTVVVRYRRPDVSGGP